MACYDSFVNRRNVHAALKQGFIIRNGALGRLPIFLAVAAKKSFSAAAGELGISASAASQAIARLESELGVVLLVRTTRSVQVTDAGARLVEQTATAMAAARDALAAIADAHEPPMGVLRLSVPRVALRCGFRHVLRAFAVAHPEITVDINVDDRLVDIVKDGFDAGVRSRESVQKDMVTSPLTGPIRFVVVGAPAYLAAHGRPEAPQRSRQSPLPWMASAHVRIPHIAGSSSIAGAISRSQ